MISIHWENIFVSSCQAYVFDSVCDVGGLSAWGKIYALGICLIRHILNGYRPFKRYI